MRTIHKKILLQEQLNTMLTEPNVAKRLKMLGYNSLLQIIFPIATRDQLMR